MASKNFLSTFQFMMVATVVSCSSASEYQAKAPKSGDAKGVTQLGKNTDTPDHGPTGEMDKEPLTPPPAGTPPTGSVPPSTGSTADMYKAMLTQGKLVSNVSISAAGLDAASDANHWFSSVNKRIPVLIAVDAAGNPIVPAGITDRQIPSGTPGSAPSGQFMANGAPVQASPTTPVSSLRVCNESGQSIYLHSGNGAPFSHGDAPIAANTCVEFLAQRAVAGDGATYDHAKGNAAANYVFLNVIKVGLDGKVVP